MKRPSRWYWLLLVVPLALGVARLRFDADVLQLLPGDLPAVRGLLLHQRHFATEGELLITLAASTPEAAERAARRVAEALREAAPLVTRAVWQPPWLEEPEATADWVAWRWLNGPPAELEALAARLEPAPLRERLEAVRSQLATSFSPLELGRSSYDPLGLTDQPGAAARWESSPSAMDQFASADGCFRLVLVSPPSGASGFRAAARWLFEVQEVVRRCAALPDWPVGTRGAFTGQPAFLAEAAQGMEQDLRTSVLGTLGVVALLFWVAHRRWAPLLWLLAMLQVVLLTTTALGGLFLGTINLVSLGFAAVLLGLSVDYALVIYQESADQTGRDGSEVRRHTARAIWGSALTTAGAFALLNFAGLPGLGQLGSLVAMGIVVAAVVMLYGFLPLVVRGESAVPREPVGGHPRCGSRRGWRWATVGLLLVGGGILIVRFPVVDHSTQPLNPQHSAAAAAARELEDRLGHGGEPILVLVSGGDELEVRHRLELLAGHLRGAQTNGTIRHFELPLELWPQPAWQTANLPGARQLAARSGALRAALFEAGFTEEAAALADRVCAAWGSADLSAGPLWPEGNGARWLRARVAAQTPTGWLALGLVYPDPEAAPFLPDFDVAGVTLCGWQLLGETLLERVEGRVGWLVAGLALALAVGLRLTLPGWTDVALSFAALAFGLFLLLTVMGLLGWSWNLMNLTALPLLLGAGVDYTIHVQLALRRHAGDVTRLRRTTGRALWLCAGTTGAAFASLGWSSNAGLASLGRVCAVGVASVLVSALYLLPAWHYAARRRPPGTD